MNTKKRCVAGPSRGEVCHVKSLQVFFILRRRLLQRWMDKAPIKVMGTSVPCNGLCGPLNLWNREVPHALVIVLTQHYHQNSESQSAVLIVPNNVTYKCMPLFMLQTFQFSLLSIPFQGRCNLEWAGSWNLLGFSSVIMVDAYRRILNAPNCDAIVL